MMLTTKEKIKHMMVCVSILVPLYVFSQGNGDNLRFQGLTFSNDVGVRGLALAGNYTSRSGDLNTLYNNLAGLADIRDIRFSVSGQGYRKLWRENQIWKPGERQSLICLYLERLYVPPIEENGVWIDSVLTSLEPSEIKEPGSGVDEYSKEAADWEKIVDDMTFNAFAVAVPMSIFGQRIVIAASYFHGYDILDYDRNATHLIPHIGTSDPIFFEVVKGDTLRMYWSDFTRKRFGAIRSVNIAIAYKAGKHLQFGAGLRSLFGKTEDSESINRVGFFDLIVDDKKFSFSYDTLDTRFSGPSRFYSLRWHLGVLLKTEHLNLGCRAELPYKMDRDWNYTLAVTDAQGLQSAQISGKDKMNGPFSYAFGMTIIPTTKTSFSIEMGVSRYAGSTFSLTKYETEDLQLFNNTTNDSIQWVNTQTLGFGAEYRPFHRFSLLAGYRTRSSAFLPYANAFRDRGPQSESLTFGLSMGIFYGRFDVAYEYRRMKYVDVYITNRNFALEDFHRVLLGYTVIL